MIQKDIYIIETYEQLKALSDALRIKIIHYLVEKAYTGQQLSQLIEIARPKVHYHLKELHKVGLIEVVRTEEKNGIQQKYYKAVARWFMPSEDLLPHIEEGTVKQSFINTVDRVKKRIVENSDENFRYISVKTDENPTFLMNLELNVSEEKFIEFTKKYWELVEEYQQYEGENTYYVGSFGFKVNEKKFKREE